MSLRRMVVLVAVVCLVGLLPVCLHAKSAKNADKKNGALVGNWEIFQTKEPGKPYQSKYKGRPFVSSGPNAFTLIIKYKPDGTFSRLSRIGSKEIVHHGKWTLSGHELRQKMNGEPSHEVIYVRFDNPTQYTSIEVYEETKDPGLFARFKRVK